VVCKTQHCMMCSTYQEGHQTHLRNHHLYLVLYYFQPHVLQFLYSVFYHLEWVCYASKMQMFSIQC
jgi:hypothetical protein